MVLLCLCVLVVTDVVPESKPEFFGYDYYTISGTRSTTETFSKSGRYLLHNYAAHFPGCPGCKSIEIQADYGATEANLVPDSPHRVHPGSILIIDFST